MTHPGQKIPVPALGCKVGPIDELTLILPYYDQPSMLLRQAEEWETYPNAVRVLVVDDGSPQFPASAVLPPSTRAEVVRIGVDIPWNRNGARNLGAFLAETDWIIHADIDHIMPGSTAMRLIGSRSFDPAAWYRFARMRVGKADETRQKDDLPDDCELGPVKPHIDSFLCTRELYWKSGGYDEDFSGSLGGSSLFLKHMEIEGGAPVVLTDLHLEVHTRHSVPDSSEPALSRDRSRYERIRSQKKAAGDPKPTTCLRFPWERIKR